MLRLKNLRLSPAPYTDSSQLPAQKSSPLHLSHSFTQGCHQKGVLTGDSSPSLPNCNVTESGDIVHYTVWILRYTSNYTDGVTIYSIGYVTWFYCEGYWVHLKKICIMIRKSVIIKFLPVKYNYCLSHTLIK